MALPSHSYEQVREAVISVLLQPRSADYPSQFGNLKSQIALLFRQRYPSPHQSGGIVVFSPADELSRSDAESIRDVFWDLFRQGHITLGLNDANPSFPFFTLSRFGESNLGTIAQDRFHDTASYLALVRARVSDLASETVTYLEEAVAAFYAGCYLSTCVMLGVAAEAEFLKLVEVGINSITYPDTFSASLRGAHLKTQIDKFMRTLDSLRGGLQPRKRFEHLDTNFSAIQAILRVARNDAGHPTGAAAPDREQVYVFLHLFPTFAEQVSNLKAALA